MDQLLHFDYSCFHNQWSVCNWSPTLFRLVAEFLGFGQQTRLFILIDLMIKIQFENRNLMKKLIQFVYSKWSTRRFNAIGKYVEKINLKKLYSLSTFRSMIAKWSRGTAAKSDVNLVNGSRHDLGTNRIRLIFLITLKVKQLGFRHLELIESPLQGHIYS